MNPRPRKFHKSDPKFGLFIIISMLFHAGILVFAVVSSSRTARADLSLNSVYVNLMEPQQFPGFVKADAGPAPENGGAQKKLEPAAPAPQPTPEKQKADKIALPKDPTKEDLKKDSGSSENAGLTDSEKKQLTDALSSIRSEVNRKQASGAEAEWQGILGDINADIEKSAYRNRVGDNYNRNWVLPSSVPEDPNLRVRVIIRIDKNGNVMDYQVLSLSGNRDLDRSVQKLLDLVKQLPVPPLSPGAQWLSIGIEFRPFQEEK